MILPNHRPITATNIAVLLAERIEPLCRELLPNGRKEGAEWRVGSINGEPGKSLGVHLLGVKAGTWADFAGDERGDALDLVKAVRGLDTIEAINWAKAWLGIAGHYTGNNRQLPRSPKTGIKTPDKQAARRTALALEIWRASRPVTGSPVETYLRARSITIPIPRSIRYSPVLKHGPTGLLLPCMVAAVQSVTGELTGVHRTFLTLDGTKKAPVSSNRMMLGPCQGGAVRFARPAEELAIGEGLESCLSVLQACPDLAVWSALSTAGLRTALLPPNVRSVTVLADNDLPGEEAAEAAAERFLREGRKVRIAKPPRGQDFNDRLRQIQHVAAPSIEEAVYG